MLVFISHFNTRADFAQLFGNLRVTAFDVSDAADFSASRFNPAIESSTHLTRFFSDVQNIGHKRAGNSNLFIRGSKSRSALKSIPVGLIILDELDEMPKANVTLALERTAGQRKRQNLKLSTPTFNDFGINFFYNLSTQEHFFFICQEVFNI